MLTLSQVLAGAFLAIWALVCFAQVIQGRQSFLNPGLFEHVMNSLIVTLSGFGGGAVAFGLGYIVINGWK